ncbi:hypothetical protein [Promicromonospora soli]
MRPDLHDLDDATWITHPAWAGSEPPLRVPVVRWKGTLSPGVRSARLTVVGLGIWEARINGTVMSPDILTLDPTRIYQGTGRPPGPTRK